MRVYDPLIPASFQQLAIKYNIPSRLWQNAFHLILERLRYAWMTHHPAALDLLTDFVYDAYKFYTDLLEDQVLMGLRVAWIEALGDLARYRMAIASHVGMECEGNGNGKGKGKGKAKAGVGEEDGEERPIPSGASIGAEVAENWDVEDKETWRTMARDWYSMGITEKPGEGRLHHHLALLCRDVQGQEGRALHHFTKRCVRVVPTLS
jgi:protein SMG6